MSGRNLNGAGSVYQRKDGRWVAAAYVPSLDGTSASSELLREDPRRREQEAA